MGGQIWLDSVKGVGTTVSFRLHLAKVINGAVQATQRRDPNPMQMFTPDQADHRLPEGGTDLFALPRDQIRIAIAEDNPINQKVRFWCRAISTRLKRYG